jgi:multimeric flavodoxin WrbA
MPRIAIVYQSNAGHTAVLAHAVQVGAQSIANTTTSLIPVSEVNGRWNELDQADAIIFGAPTFMGNVPADFKRFMDDSSVVWASQGWRNKLAAGFTCSACWSGDKLNTLMQMTIFAAQHAMIWVPLGTMPGYHTSQGTPRDLNRVGGFLGAMAQANADESSDVAPPQCDRDTAQALGKQVAEVATRFIYGTR